MIPRLVEFLERPGNSTSIIDATTCRKWTYRELAADVSRLASSLVSQDKSLVACFCRTSASSVIGYLAALAAGHAVVLLNADGDVQQTKTLLERYRPEYLIEDGLCKRFPYSPSIDGRLNDDLAVLLCTSGSTGSPKLVRLSAQNIDANAEQIVECLKIGQDDRAIQSLPLHYCYGLSVLNSHLLAGASIVLTPTSVVQPDFWKTVQGHGCTSFAGVPYAYTILTKLEFENFVPSSLRTMTQAGGHMPPHVVERFARIMRARGGRLVVMYGQTEATARISYVPPDRVLEKCASIGIPVSRGQLSLDAEGELIYKGPNVMLGYAHKRADLAKGDVNRGVLATGDIASIDGDGMFSIIGRKRRIGKFCGRRINLDEVESSLAAAAPVAVLQLGEQLVIVREAGAVRPTQQELLQHVSEYLRLPSRFIMIREVDRLPLTAAGKTNYLSIANELSAHG